MLRPVSRVAQRAASTLRRAVPLAFAVAIAGTTIAVSAAPAQAAAGTGVRVVIVVGPSGGATSDYLSKATSYAAQARSYGASVSEIYTPNATWARVRAASQGANVFIYLGHGNGWPSPYAPFQTATKDGLGLNAYQGSGNVTPTYYGEGPIASQIRLAPGAIVLLNRLCYASGAGESGAPNPTWDVARQRVDNYAAGFLRAGAAAVLADGHTSLTRELGYLFGPGRNLLDAWRADPDANGHVRAYASQRTPGFTTYLDPDGSTSGFYRALTTKSWVATSGIRVAAMHGTAESAITLRTSPSTGASSVGTVATGAKTWVIGNLTTDSAGRTWTPVITTGGVRGWVAGWLEAFGGTAVAATDVRVRSTASTTASTLTVVASGVRVKILGSKDDGAGREWLRVTTSSGVTGWMAAWLMRP